MLLTRRNQLTIDPVREFIDAFNRDFGAGINSGHGSHLMGAGGEMGFPMDISESNGELVIRTDATLFTAGVSSVINGAGTSVVTFQPVIPEPASLGLLGAAALIALRRRRL